MCSISGIVEKLNAEALCTKSFELNKALLHRGPDGHDTTISNFTQQFNVALSMTRLAIRGTTELNQPMVSPDGRFRLVFNGEIFNCDELRAQFPDISVDDETSDTEVLFSLLVNYGIKGIEYVQGMFAFAFFDQIKERIYLARDTLGFKPLYYYYNNDIFIFASEIPAIKMQIKTNINKYAISDYLTYGYINDVNGLYTNIVELKPGEILEYSSTGIQKKKYGYRKSTQNQDLNTSFQKSVISWLASNDKFTLGLSGGIDSNLLFYQILNSDFKEKLRPISIIFNNDMSEAEAEFSYQICSKECVDLTVKKVSDEELFNGWQQSIKAISEPFCGGISSYFLYQKTAEMNIKVCLTGSGGDELTNNYGFGNHYSGLGRLRRYKNYIKNEGKITDIMRLPFGCLHAPLFFTNAAKQRLGCALTEKYASESLSDKIWDPHDVINANIKTQAFQLQLPNEFLKMTDRLSMYHGVEARTPFLDQKFSLDFLTYSNSRKTISRNKEYFLKLLQNYSPEYKAIKKRGFPTPYKQILKVYKDHRTVEQLKSSEANLSSKLGCKINNDKFFLKYSQNKVLSEIDWCYLNLLEWNKLTCDE